MPITLPAPSTPELGTAEAIRGSGSAYVDAAFQQNQIHVIGPDVVSKEALTGAITGAENLSDVVRRIQAAYYLAGYPSVNRFSSNFWTAAGVIWNRASRSKR